MKGAFRFLKVRKISFLLVIGYLLFVTLYIPENRAFAGTATSTVNVSAAVAKNCTVNTTTQLAFGNYDPVVANATAPLDTNGAVAIHCTKNVAFKLYLSQGSNPGTGSTDTAPVRQMSDGVTGDPFMSYKVTTDSAYATNFGGTGTTGTNYDSGTSTSAGTAISETLYGQVAAGQDLPVASFTDTLTATVSF